MSARRDRIELFTEEGCPGAHYRWSYVSANGRILADSGQGYSRRIDALNGARRVTGLDLDNACDYRQDISGQARQVWEVAR